MSGPRVVRVLAAFVLILTACEQPRAVTPALELPGDAPVDRVPTDASPADAAPPDAAPRPIHCKFESVAADEVRFTRYRFKGVVPWIDLESPVSSSCCLLPSSKVLCIVTEKVWSEIPTSDGELSIASYIERARLFERDAEKPRRDAVLAVFHPGPMNDPIGHASAPLFRARVEMDTGNFRIVTKDDGVCHGRPLRCDQDVVGIGACRAYRRHFASLVRDFCASLGDTAW